MFEKNTCTVIIYLVVTFADTAESLDNDQLNMHQAWSDLSYIEHEQERYVALRSKTVSELDSVRQQAVALENVKKEKKI
jgi:hypothetical protein